jgi:hypothetical protein
MTAEPKTGPILLSGGNPQIAKGDGDEPVQAYIAAMPGWKSAVGREVDALVGSLVPGVRKKVRWNSPFYGAPGADDWFLSFHCFNRFIRLTFFNGAVLTPMPPGASKHPRVRYLDLYEDDPLDDPRLVNWITAASQLPGEKM